MSWLDILLLAIIATWALASVVIILVRKKKGKGCCGDCAKCKSSCPSAKK